MQFEEKLNNHKTTKEGKEATNPKIIDQVSEANFSSEVNEPLTRNMVMVQ